MSRGYLYTEVENIFLIEPILMAVAEQLLLPSKDEVIEAVKKWIVDEFEKNLATHVTSVTFEVVDYKLNSLHKSGAGKDDVVKEVKLLFDKINIEEIFTDVELRSKKMIAGKDYEGILAVINQKGLLPQVGKFFNVKPTYYIQMVKQILDHNKADLLSCVAKYLPDFQGKTITKTS